MSGSAKHDPPEEEEAAVAAFVARWRHSAAAERANYQLFLVELCDVLGLPHPMPATGEPEHDEYRFEHPVEFHNPDGSTSRGFIDLYRHDCFVPTARQSWPRDLPDQFKAVRAFFALEAAPAAADEIAICFRRARRDRVAAVLETLVSLGQARRAAPGRHAA